MTITVAGDFVLAIRRCSLGSKIRELSSQSNRFLRPVREAFVFEAAPFAGHDGEIVRRRGPLVHQESRHVAAEKILAHRRGNPVRRRHRGCKIVVTE